MTTEARHTPITDALSTDPAIERRDVPARVWREMARLEQQRDELAAALRDCVDAINKSIPEQDFSRLSGAADSAWLVLDNIDAKVQS